MQFQPKYKAKVKSFVYNALDDDAQRLEAFEKHHVAEVEELRAEIDRLRGIINDHIEDEKDHKDRQW